MNIAIILTHNKGTLGNVAQITALTALLTIHEQVTPAFDVNFLPIPGSEVITHYYTINGLLLDHKVLIYQIVPFDATPPSNLYDIDSHKFLYNEGNETEMVGDHPRFFNVGLKRGTDHGADIVLQLEDVTKLNITDLTTKLPTLLEPTNPTEFAESAYGRFATLKCLKQVGQMNETKSFSNAIIDYKQKVVAEGLVNG